MFSKKGLTIFMLFADYFDIAFGWLGIRQIRGFEPFDHVLVTIEHKHETFTNFIVSTTCCDQMLSPGNFRRFAKK